jgi:hypothetical protein
MIALELRLTGTPDASWIEGFYLHRGAQQQPFDGRAPAELPRIEGDLICWSIRTSELQIAWQHLIRCLERANFRRSRDARDARDAGSRAILDRRAPTVTSASRGGPELDVPVRAVSASPTEDR